MKRWLGPALKKVREDAKITQMAIRDAMRTQGHNTYPSTISRWETGATWPDDIAETLGAYCAATEKPERLFWTTALELWDADDATHFEDAAREEDRRRQERDRSPEADPHDGDGADADG